MSGGLSPSRSRADQRLVCQQNRRRTPRTGESFWFMPNTAVSVIVARIVEEASR
jgi:hypothetical protein